MIKTIQFEEEYLESSQTLMMECFSASNKWLKSVNCFRNKAPLWMFHWVLNTPPTRANNNSYN